MPSLKIKNTIIKFMEIQREEIKRRALDRVETASINARKNSGTLDISAIQNNWLNDSGEPQRKIKLSDLQMIGWGAK